MPIEQHIKDIAYQLDRECWHSYSGKPREVRSYMDSRRTAALAQAQRIADGTEPAPAHIIPPEPPSIWKRPDSTVSVRDLRDREGISTFDANKRVTVARLLDRVDAAETVDELRALLAEFITMQTGIS